MKWKTRLEKNEAINVDFSYCKSISKYVAILSSKDYILYISALLQTLRNAKLVWKYTSGTWYMFQKYMSKSDLWCTTLECFNTYLENGSTLLQK